MAPTSIKYAIHKGTGRSMFIDEVDNGLKCNCTCKDCGDDMIANQGNINQHYFDHANGDRSCKGAQETALHQFAKQIIIDNSQINIPKFGTINYTESIAEKEFVSYRPDVTAVYNGQKIFFEVAVTHFNEPDKDKFFIDGQYKSIEINLGEVQDNWTPEGVKEKILRQTDNKRIIFWEANKMIQRDAAGANGFWNWLLAIGLIILSFILFRNYRAKKNRS